MIGAVSLFSRLSPGSVGETGFAGSAATGKVDIGASFADALGNAAGGVVATLRNADAISVSALTGGDVSTRQVVDAVMSAEQALQSSIAIRDKIVSAYLEISRMSI